MLRAPGVPDGVPLREGDEDRLRVVDGVPLFVGLAVPLELAEPDAVIDDDCVPVPVEVGVPETDPLMVPETVLVALPDNVAVPEDEPEPDDV